MLVARFYFYSYTFRPLGRPWVSGASPSPASTLSLRARPSVFGEGGAKADASSRILPLPLFDSDCSGVLRRRVYDTRGVVCPVRPAKLFALSPEQSFRGGRSIPEPPLSDRHLRSVHSHSAGVGVHESAARFQRPCGVRSEGGRTSGARNFPGLRHRRGILNNIICILR